MVDLRVDTSLQESSVDIADLGTVHLRELGGLDRLEMEQQWASYSDKGPDIIRRMALLIAYSAVDANGTRLYANEDVEDIARTQSADALQALFVAALRLNHMDTETVEDRVGNSAPIQAA